MPIAMLYGEFFFELPCPRLRLASLVKSPGFPGRFCLEIDFMRAKGRGGRGEGEGTISTSQLRVDGKINPALVRARS